MSVRRKAAGALVLFLLLVAFPAQADRGFSHAFCSLNGQTFYAERRTTQEATYWFEAMGDMAFVQRMDRRIQQIEAQVGETEPIDVYVLRDATMVADRLAEPIFQENALILTASLEETCLPALANACLREEERWVGEGVAYLVEHGAPEEETLAQEYSDAGNMAALGMDDLCFLPSLRAEEMIVLSRMTAANWWLRGGAEAPDRNAWLDAIGAACEFVPDAELLPDYSAYATAEETYDVHIRTQRAEYDIALQDSHQYTILDEASLREFVWRAERAMAQIAAYLAPYAAQGLADIDRAIEFYVDESRWEIASYTYLDGAIYVNYWPKDCLEHEIAHAYTITQDGSAWMEEGFATWVENAVAFEYQFLDDGRDVRLAWLDAASRGKAHMYSGDPFYTEYLAALLRLYQLGGGTLSELDATAYLDARAILSLGYFGDLEGIIWYEMEAPSLRDVYSALFSFDGAELTYAGAGSLFAYLVRETSLEEALRAMREPERFEEIAGGDYEALCARWQQYLEETYCLEPLAAEAEENPETLPQAVGQILDALEGILNGDF